MLSFGSSGFLYQSNKLMFDRGTRSLWHALTGEPVLGPLVGSGKSLELLPVSVTTWEEWTAEHPNSLTIAFDTGFQRPYIKPGEPGAAYTIYFNTPELMFPVFELNPLFDAKTPVYALRTPEEAKAYPIDVVSEEQVINDVFSSMEIVVVGDPDARSARVYRRDGHVFGPGPNSRLLLDGMGREWEVGEEELIPPQDSGEASLPRVAGHQAFWFGWTNFYPETELYVPSG